MHADQAEYELRFAIHTATSGRVEMRYFASPTDDGVTLHLSPREREQMAEALELPGFHVITRSDVPDRQMCFEFREVKRKARPTVRKEAA